MSLSVQKVYLLSQTFDSKVDVTTACPQQMSQNFDLSLHLLLVSLGSDTIVFSQYIFFIYTILLYFLNSNSCTFF